MAMGRRRREEHGALWIAASDLPQSGGHPFFSEPDRGRRNWEEKLEEREAVYGNRRRIRGDRGKRLMRRRGELVERSFAHCYDTGGDASDALA